MQIIASSLQKSENLKKGNCIKLWNSLINSRSKKNVGCKKERNQLMEEIDIHDNKNK